MAVVLSYYRSQARNSKSVN